jgi:hypothetical protein
VKEPVTDRIARRLHPESECLIWQGARDKDGYGVIQIDGRQEKVHRTVWFIAHGPIPKGLVVRHAVCDNPPCARLDHLALGTHVDNMADMVARGRTNAVRGDAHYTRRRPDLRPYGEVNGSAKVTDEQVGAIREMYATGQFRQIDVARAFGISQIQVSRIVRGESRWLRRPQETTT